MSAFIYLSFNFPLCPRRNSEMTYVWCTHTSRKESNPVLEWKNPLLFFNKVGPLPKSCTIGHTFSISWGCCDCDDPSPPYEYCQRLVTLLYLHHYLAANYSLFGNIIGPLNGLHSKFCFQAKNLLEMLQKKSRQPLFCHLCWQLQELS